MRDGDGETGEVGQVGERVTVWVTGFGPFLDVVDNPSSRLAVALEKRSGTAWEARALELPTAFRRARERFLDFVMGGPVDFVLALGVGRGGLRLERVARGVVSSEHADIDGEVWAGRRLGPDLTNPLPLETWAERLGGEPPFTVSEDCGGYVCNAMNHHVLSAFPGRALFVHVPRELSDSADFATVEAQLAALIDLAVAHVRAEP